MQQKCKKKLLIVPYADHNNLASVSGEEYLQTIKDFKRSLVLNNKRLKAGEIE